MLLGDNACVLTYIYLNLVKTRNLTPNFTPSPFPNEDAAITSDSIASLDQQATRPEQLEQLKKLCLERDNFCCLATGFVELFESQRAPGLRSMPTELAHIVPFSRSWCGSTEQVCQYTISPSRPSFTPNTNRSSLGNVPSSCKSGQHLQNVSQISNWVLTTSTTPETS